MKLAVLGYVPPPTFPNAEVFHENIRKFPTTTPVILFSDHPYEDVIPIKSPDSMGNRHTDQGRENKFAVNNLIFFTSLRIAEAHGITHMLYLESDCRVGCHGWDGKVFDEFFAAGGPHIIGGSIAVYNPCNAGPLAAKRWEALVAGNTRRNVPIPTYGWKPSADDSGSCVFVNGALGVYDVAWMRHLFNLDDTANLARNATAWDMEIGMELWRKFGPDAYEVVAHLTSIFSSYGNVLTTEAERLELVRSGAVVAIHQVKSPQTF